MTQFGIRPYVKDLIFKELNALLFTFPFVKTFISQIKNQCDAYPIYNSNHFEHIVIAYIWTVLDG